MEPGELISCPTCSLPADVVPPGPYELFSHSRCAAGHDNTLIPAVLEHLRFLEAKGFPESA